MAGPPGAWVIRPEDRYTITYDYRGGKERFKKLKAALISHKDANLIDQILKSPLGDIYKAMENFNYSSTVVHQLLIRSVYSDRNDELRFRFRDSICRLGQTEFALITGLYFGVVEPDIRPVEDRNRSSLIECDNHVIGDVDMTMAPFRLEVSHITICFLEKALMAATDAEIAYKLGLIYLIEAVLHGKASASNVSPFVFYLVEDVPRFLHYSWGSYFWDITLQNLMDKRDGMMSHIGRKVVKKDVTCLVYVLFVWAYETIPSVGLLIARYVANNKVIPRMLRWHPNEGNINHKFLSKNLDSQDHGVNTYFKPSDAEVQMLRGIGLTDDKINMPPLVCTIPRDASHQRGCVSPFPAPIYDTHRANAHSERVSAFDTAPPKSHSTVLGITQLHTQLLGLRSYALSMPEEVLKDVKDGNEDVRENIDGARNDITYGRKLIRAELETVRIAQ